MTLSEEKAIMATLKEGVDVNYYREEDVKEFIKKLKDKFSDEPMNNYIARDVWFEINKLAGEELI